MKKIFPKDFKKGQCIRFFRKKTQSWQVGYAIITKGTKDNRFTYRYSLWNPKGEGTTMDITPTLWVDIYDMYRLSKEEVALLNLSS
jgi:hypothetical protein